MLSNSVLSNSLGRHGLQPTRHRVSCIGEQILDHCTTWEAHIVYHTATNRKGKLKKKKKKRTEARAATSNSLTVRWYLDNILAFYSF